MKSGGFTLTEMVFTISIALLILGVGIPFITRWIDTNRLKDAAETIHNDFEYARREAIRRNKSITLSFVRTSDSIWCYGLKENAACNCLETVPTAPDFCAMDGVPKQVSSTALTGIKLKNIPFNGSISFSPLRATLHSGSVQLESSKAKLIHIILQDNGYIRVCSPPGTGNIWEYPLC